MRALIFAAGLGTRLKPFTLEHPKALVEVGGEPMLKRVIMKLKTAGISEMVVNVHHFASQIIDYLRANDNFGCTIHISDESELLLDTGGGILKAKEWLDKDNEPFLAHNADILTDFSIEQMAERHKASANMATLLVSERTTSRYLMFDPQDRMVGWTNVSTGEVRPAGAQSAGARLLAFGGVHIINPDIFRPLEAFRGENTPFSIIDFYIDYCSAASFGAYTPAGAYMWHDIGKPESLLAAEKDIAKCKAMLNEPVVK